MNVIAAKLVTDAARRWLLEHGAEIHHVQGLSIVFLPKSMRMWRSDIRMFPSYIDDGCGQAAVYIPNDECDSERTIYARGEEEVV